VLQGGRKLVLVEVDDVIIRAVEQMGVAVFIGAEVFCFFAVVDKQTFESACGAVEIVESVSSGTQIVPARRACCPAPGSFARSTRSISKPCRRRRTVQGTASASRSQETGPKRPFVDRW